MTLMNQIDFANSPVAMKLATTDDTLTASAIHWQNAQRERSRTLRRSWWIAFSGWLLVAFASLVSAGIAITLTLDLYTVLTSAGPESIPSLNWRNRNDVELKLSWRNTLVPALLVFVSVFVCFAGLIALIKNSFPGYGTVYNAIQWSSACDAMARLLASGSTYPEALRLVASENLSRSTSLWFCDAADRIERGEANISLSKQSKGPQALVEAMVESVPHSPSQAWRIAAIHFQSASHRREVILASVLPALCTVLAAALLWLAITTTLNWFWMSTFDAINSFASIQGCGGLV